MYVIFQGRARVKTQTYTSFYLFAYPWTHINLETKRTSADRQAYFHGCNPNWDNSSTDSSWMWNIYTYCRHICSTLFHINWSKLQYCTVDSSMRVLCRFHASWCTIIRLSRVQEPWEHPCSWVNHITEMKSFETPEIITSFDKAFSHFGGYYIAEIHLPYILTYALCICWCKSYAYHPIGLTWVRWQQKNKTQKKHHKKRNWNWTIISPRGENTNSLKNHHHLQNHPATVCAVGNAGTKLMLLALSTLG